MDEARHVHRDRGLHVITDPSGKNRPVEETLGTDCLTDRPHAHPEDHHHECRIGDGQEEAASTQQAEGNTVGRVRKYELVLDGMVQRTMAREM
jgi:hypothetical protein